MKSNPFVMNQLLALAGDRHQKDTNASIARSLLQHFSDLPDLTIQDAADLAYVSAASISRFVRYLGYSGFSEFKYSCRETLGIETDYSGEVKKARKEDLQPIYERFTDQVVSNIQLAHQNLDIARLDRICQAIQEADQTAIFGLEFSSLIGEHIQGRLARMGKLVSTSLELDEQAEIARSLTKDSVAILITMEGGYLYRNPEVMEILTKTGVYTVVLTISPHLKMLQSCDEMLVCGRDNYNTEARISLLYLAEMLLMHYSISYFQKEY